jgi:hypothetical protein
MIKGFEEDLRRALAHRADEAPSGASHRLRHLDYHPRCPRARRLLLMASGLGISGVVAVALSLVGLGTGTQRAFAGWTLAPTTPEGRQVAAADAKCVKQLPTSGRFSRLRGLGWHFVLSDTRGPFTVVLYEAGGARAEASCFNGPSRYDWGANVGIGRRPTLASRGFLAVTSYGTRTLPRSAGEHHFKQITGRTGPGVRSVAVVLRDGTRVIATTERGWFLAWWPGTQQAVSAEVTTVNGTTVQRLGIG